MSYFSRNFKTIKGVKFAIFLKKPYDWVRLTLKGQTILSQKYGVESCFLIRLGGEEKQEKGKHYYRIMNMIWTQEMLDDLNQNFQNLKEEK